MDVRHAARVLVVLVVAAAVGIGVAEAGLEAHWSFDEGSGSTVTDSVNGNVGTLLDGSYVPPAPTPSNTNPPTFSSDVPAATRPTPRPTTSLADRAATTRR